MKSAKIIVTGPVRAGTTTFIRSLSEIAVLTTERRLDVDSAAPGAERTVALDFGRVTIAADLVLYLFGTPGEEPESLVAGPLAEGTIGVIVTVDASRPASIDDAARIVAFLKENSDVRFAVAANRADVGDEKRLSLLRDALALPETAALIPCDVTQRESSKAVVLALLDDILDHGPTLEPVLTAGEVR
jgi:signal recognition particle receptor subunit beta